MASFAQDVRYAIRGVMRNRTVTAVAVLTIGIGIGVNTTVFGWIQGLLLNPLPGASDAGRIVAVENTAANGDPLTSSYLDYRDYRDHLRSFETLSAITPAALAVGDDQNAARVWGELVSGNYFDMMSVKPAAGRFFAAAERDDAQNAHAVAVISYSYWKNQYELNPAALGSTIRVNRTPVTIIGVAPAEFHGSQSGLEFNIWVPVTMYGQLTHTGTWMLRDRNTRNFFMMGRLSPGVSIETARTETKALANLMAVANAPTNKGVGAEVLPVWKGHFTPQSVLLAPIGILMGASGVVLLIVCANIANLLLARATGRRKEFSVRLALGAGPRQLVKQMLTEMLLLSCAGAVAGVIISGWLGGALRWLLPQVAAPAILQPALDVGTLLFTSALAFGVTILAGIGPALHASRSNVNEILKEGGRSGPAGARTHMLGGALVVGEVALAVIALVAAGLFLKSYQQARAIDPGFDPQGIALARFDFSTAGFNANQTDVFCRTLRERLEREPGVKSVSYDDTPPLGFTGGNWEPIEVEGYMPAPNENMKIWRDMVAPGFFDVMKIPLLSGRDFDMRDFATSLHDDKVHQKVMIVNQEFVRRFFPNTNPLGRRVRGWGEWFTVVGVARNAKYQKYTESPQPYFYIPIRQVYRPEYGLTFYVRTSGSVSSSIAAIRREAKALDPGLPLFDSMPMTEYVSAALYGQRVGAVLLNFLSAMGLLMAAMGLYSVMAYSVAQRTGEIGIRMALGATQFDTVLLVLRQGCGFALTGFVLGSVIAAILARAGSALLVSVSAVDPLVYGAAAAFIVTLALLSTALPAMRAVRVDPVVALRGE